MRINSNDDEPEFATHFDDVLNYEGCTKDECKYGKVIEKLTLDDFDKRRRIRGHIGAVHGFTLRQICIEGSAAQKLYLSLGGTWPLSLGGDWPW